MNQPPMADGVPGRQHLTGYRMREYDQLIAALAASRESQGIPGRELARRVGEHRPNVIRTLHGHYEARGGRLFALAHALGYDLALIPREDS